MKSFKRQYIHSIDLTVNNFIQRGLDLLSDKFMGTRQLQVDFFDDHKRTVDISSIKNSGDKTSTVGGTYDQERLLPLFNILIRSSTIGASPLYRRNF